MGPVRLSGEAGGGLAGTQKYKYVFYTRAPLSSFFPTSTPRHRPCRGETFQLRPTVSFQHLQRTAHTSVSKTMNYTAHVNALVEAQLAALDTSQLHPSLSKKVVTATTTMTTTTTTAPTLSKKYTTPDALPLVCAHAQARYLRSAAIHSCTGPAMAPLHALATLEHADTTAAQRVLDQSATRKRQRAQLQLTRSRDKRQRTGHVLAFQSQTWTRRVNTLVSTLVERENHH